MIGREVPVVGMVRRNCNGTRRVVDDKVIGLIDMAGVPSVVGSLADAPIKACSARGGDVDSIVVRWLITNLITDRW